jgi:membrane-bound metal-dependent hydrolase YbcI (DUF457 family)
MDIPLGVALGDPVGWHHGPTHSLLGAGLIGGALALLARGRAARVAALAGCLLHVPMDWSTGDAAEAARFGVPLFWPLSETKYISDPALFGAFHINKEGFLLNLLAPEAAAVWGRELAFIAAVLALVAIVRRARAGREQGAA